MSAQAMLLPYIEQAPVYNSLNFNIGAEYDLGMNSTGVLTIVAGFLCPSDPNATKARNTNNYYSCMGTTTDYMFRPGVAGGANWEGTTPNVTFTGSTGLFAQAVSYGIRHCTDGTSNTVAYAESLLGDSMATSVWTGVNSTPPSKYRGNMVFGADPGDDLNRPHDAFQKIGDRHPDAPGMQHHVPGDEHEHRRRPRLPVVDGDYRVLVVQHDPDAEREAIPLLRLPARWRPVQLSR